MRLLNSGVEDSSLDTWRSWTFKIGICCFSTKHTTYRVRTKTGCITVRTVCPRGATWLLFQWASKIVRSRIHHPFIKSVTCYTPTRREAAILQSPCLSVCPSVHTFVKDVSAATGRKDFIFDTWLWHSDLYHVSPFQAYCTSTSCLPRDLEFFMFAVIKTFVTDISASTGRNDFIFNIWLLHGELYRVSPFQVYRLSTSCLPHD